MRTVLPTAAVIMLFASACGGAKPPAGGAGAAKTDDPTTAPAAATTPDGDSPTPAAGEAPPPAGTYRIVLERAFKKGAKLKRTVVVTDSRNETVVKGGKTIKEGDNRMRITLIADEDILEVGSDGEPTKKKLVIATFAAAGAKGDEPILPPKTELSIVRKPGAPGAEVTSSTGELTKDQAQALSMVVSLGPTGASDDDVFGTKTPQAPGASWDIAKDAAVRDLGAFGVQTTPALVEGRTTLVAAREDRGEPCLEVAAKMTAKVTGFAGISGKTTIEKGTITAEATSIAPVDTTKLTHRTSNRVGMEIVAKAPTKSGEVATVTITSLQVTETTLEPR